MEPQRIPRTVDDPPMFMMWPVDEVAPFMICLVVGFFTGELVVLITVGALASRFYSQFRDGQPDGYLQHLLYSIGFMPTNQVTIRNPFNDHFLP